MIRWKWSNGSFNHQSSRYVSKGQDGGEEKEIERDQRDREPEREEEQNVNLSLMDLNTREQLDSKITTRELMLNSGNNPFFSEQTYIQDVVNRDLYLKPINTSSNKIKQS
jgi:hypothetical protein